MENKHDDYEIKWDDNYLIGCDDVDAQHKQIFDHVNSLIKSCIDGSDTAKVKETLDFLVNYAVHHFDDEEALQIKCHFPEYLLHKKLHDDFKITVIDLVKRFNEKGSSSELSTDINQIVKTWLHNHIISEDKKIGIHINSVDDVEI